MLLINTFDFDKGCGTKKCCATLANISAIL